MRLTHLVAVCVTGMGLALPTQALRAQPDPAEIFLEEDTDTFDPGLPIGAPFPAIRALYQGREISRIDEFFGDRGLVFFAVRSVDW